ncbi:MAG: chromate efflux transporter [Dehalococcoidia bacterium]|nr:chromate efflux transporter [Dehalococcoidia bacterium]
MSTTRASRGSPGEVARYFARLGAIAFGGPAAHIALMRRELVAEKRWVTDQEFADLLGVTNLIPGPNSTEMTMHLGHQRAGWRGLWLGGLCFIAPAVAIVLALAWAYVEYGTTPAGEGILLGAQPVVLAIIVQAVWGLRGAVIKGPATLLVVAGAVVLSLFDVQEFVIIIGAGLALLGWTLLRRWGPRGGAAAGAFLPIPLLPGGWWAAAAPAGYSLGELFLVFLKIGAVLYGSGYVLLAFIETDLVEGRGWLTEEQLVDAIAVGQFTPGPVFTTATFIGYVLDGVPGAAAATAGIFLPSFLFVALTHPLVPRLRRSPWASPFLDGVNAAAVALMASVCVTLGREALDDWFQAALLGVAALVLVRFNPNSAWIVLGGAGAGLLYELVR